MIASNKTLEDIILKLIPKHEQVLLKKQKLDEKLLNANYKVAIGSVVDTLVLRIILRRFLEGYHGLEPFTKQDDLKDIGLGEREGRMQEVIEHLAEIKYKTITEENLKKAVDSVVPAQLSWDLFNEVTMDVEMKNSPVPFADIYDRLQTQFELAYGGDLFSGDIAEVVNKVEKEINKHRPELLLKLVADTSDERFNFRYEDLPPEMIQDFYENSMSYSLHYAVNDKGEPVVSYSDDLQQKKHRGAYYTKQDLVDYMIANSVGKKLEEYQKDLSNGIKQQDKKKIMDSLCNIVNLTVVDITCGGGSFLRGAFRYLSSKRENIVRTLENIKDKVFREEILAKFPYFKIGSDYESLWEKHVLLEMVYGIDIDYKALIISSQTLTLSALSNWQIGQNFPRLIGLTLIHQNALIFPVRTNEREKLFKPFKDEIKEIIQLRKKIKQSSDPEILDKLMIKLEKIRLTLQEKLY